MASSPDALTLESPIIMRRALRRPIGVKESTNVRMQRMLAVACLIMFTEGFVATMVFPYASFMVKEMRATELDLGFYTGLIFTAFPIGTVLTTRQWGSLSNRIGRRPCLLLSLAMGGVNVTAIALCRNYAILVAIRVSQGVLNCSLPMIRTALREAVAANGADEVGAFAKLQATFGASALAGPALGGLMYGLLRDSVTAWAAPQFMATLLYIMSFVCAYVWLDETANVDTNRSDSVKSEQDPAASLQDPPALLQDLKFKYMLIMVGAHSYFFTGWEVGYPLFAQDTRIGQGWTTQQIGFNFLVGSMGLMFYSLCGFAIVERHLGLESIWRWSWLLVLVLLPIFPRAVATVASSPGAVQLVNYFVQICISVLIGSQFLTLQLLMNKYIARRPDGGVALSIANGWMVSAQAVARAVSPIFTGSLFTLSHDPNIGDRGLVFDSLAAVGLVLCVFVGILYERETAATSCEVAQALLAA